MFGFPQSALLPWELVLGDMGDLGFSSSVLLPDLSVALVVLGC